MARLSEWMGPCPNWRGHGRIGPLGSATAWKCFRDAVPRYLVDLYVSVACDQGYQYLWSASSGANRRPAELSYQSNNDVKPATSFTLLICADITNI